MMSQHLGSILMVIVGQDDKHKTAPHKLFILFNLLSDTEVRPSIFPLTNMFAADLNC